MDYDQWTPLGRGDPLKNDPTYDYVPPVLDRVHYWLDPSARRPDAPVDSKKTEILLLGVSAKKPSADSRRDRYDPYLQYVDGGYRGRRPEYGIPASYYPSPFYKGTDKGPYTMLLPPPMHEAVSYRTTTLSPTSVSVEESRLVFQESSIGLDTHATLASNQVTWRTPVNKNVPGSFSGPSMNVVVESGGEMVKGQVTDDALDPSSTYVSIGKPDAHVQSEIEELSTEPLTPPMEDAPMSFQTFKAPLEQKPMTLQMTMQTPSSVELGHKKHNMFLHSLPKKEPVLPTIPPATTTPTPPPPTTTPTTTSTSSLTTDPLFKHYKQPAEPIKGPLYLIIQGHSKVKTYGPKPQLSGISIQESNEISTSDDRNPYQVKHLHHEIKKEEWKRESRSHKLHSLNQIVETGLGSINYDKEGQAMRRSDGNVKETELVVKYDVSSGEEGTSEVYHKGIVESDNPPSRLFPMVSKKV